MYCVKIEPNTLKNIKVKGNKSLDFHLIIFKIVGTN